MSKVVIKEFECLECKMIWQYQNGIDIYNKFAFLNPTHGVGKTICKLCFQKKQSENPFDNED